MCARWQLILPSTSRVSVFVDANVLASPVPRTMLYLLAPLSGYRLVFSPLVEAEAQRHQKAGHVRVATLRQRWDWTLVPDSDHTPPLVDTDPKDKPVLAAAIHARAAFVVTGNIRHFGVQDLEANRVSAVHPGLFLAHHATPDSYREVLEAISAGRTREPRDPLSIHEQEIAVHLPALFTTYRDLFGTPHPVNTHQPPATVFRGPRCVRCSQLQHPGADGLCDSCRASVT